MSSVEIFRNKSKITSFFGSFGMEVKETRLTSALGYLISLSPNSFLELFQIKDEIISIAVEEKEQSGRVDIKIRTKKEVIDVEAKVNSIDPLKQSLNYSGDKKILITNHIPTRAQKALRNIIYLDWTRIAEHLILISKNKYSGLKFISLEMIDYLKEHNMIKNEKPVEVYLREINDNVTLKLFLKANFYCCNFIKDSKLYKSIYFAPHFGYKLEVSSPGVEAGISYIARINDLVVVEDWDHFIETINKHKGTAWMKKHKKLIDIIGKEWNWKNQKRIVFLLGNPIHAFNPPIKKQHLQAGKGWLSKLFLSFDDLFKARTEKIY